MLGPNTCAHHLAQSLFFPNTVRMPPRPKIPPMDAVRMVLSACRREVELARTLVSSAKFECCILQWVPSRQTGPTSLRQVPTSRGSVYSAGSWQQESPANVKPNCHGLSSSRVRRRRRYNTPEMLRTRTNVASPRSFIGTRRGWLDVHHRRSVEYLHEEITWKWHAPRARVSYAQQTARPVEDSPWRARTVGTACVRTMQKP